MIYFPAPYETSTTDYAWDQLMVGVSDVSVQTIIPLIEDFWSTVVPKINIVRGVDIHGPKEEAWFHMRRTSRQNPEEKAKQWAYGRIEIFRLKRGFIPDDIKEELRSIPENHPNAVCAGWWGINFSERHDNAFLSFLQKLSVLRSVNKIAYLKLLANISDDYEKCHYCQEAFQIMLSQNQPWSGPLRPWINYFATSGLDPNRTHEYAHWFGHILSGWSR